MILQADVIQRSAKASKRYPKPVGSTETAELAATFHVWFQVQEHTGNSSPLELAFQPGNDRTEIPEDRFMAAVANVSGNKVLQRFLVNVA